MAKVVTKVVDQLAELKWLLAILVEKPLDAQMVAEQVVVEQVVADLAAEQKWLLAILVVKLQAAIVAAVVVAPPPALASALFVSTILIVLSAPWLTGVPEVPERTLM